MVIVMKPCATEEEVQRMIDKVTKLGMEAFVSRGVEQTIIGLVGDTSVIDKGLLEMDPSVERVIRIQEPYKKANRNFHPNNTVVDVLGHQVGGNAITVIAGPCSVESREQIVGIAEEVKSCGASMLRGGAYKPRSSPYAFQGLKEDGLDLLMEARAHTALPIVSEITSISQLERFVKDVDVIQIGARNMQNFELLKEMGKVSKPILLKRGLSATLEEWLMSAEYIMSAGNENVILCERGIRTFETFTRNTVDLSAIPAIKRLSHLPIIVDPSHATGYYWMVEPIAMAAVAAGADGLIIEVHNDPQHALCDGQQSITPHKFASIMEKLEAVSGVCGRSMEPAARKQPPVGALA